MVDYAIGDVQGCYDPLLRLLDQLDFDDRSDRLWFVGDLVNRGPQSLAVLRFIRQLPTAACITLGNHDLHLLSCLFTPGVRHHHDDTLDAILHADDAEEIGHWLRQQSILIHDPGLNLVMCHAGIAPVWDLAQAKGLAQELETVLQGENFRYFLLHMYGNQPDHWSEDLVNLDRLRLICNYFTRMRFCNAAGDLVLSYKGGLTKAPPELYPWFNVPHRRSIEADIIFGHWAALQGQCPVANMYALDTGCFWGGSLTALRLQDRVRFAVACH